MVDLLENQDTYDKASDHYRSRAYLDLELDAFCAGLDNDAGRPGTRVRSLGDLRLPGGFFRIPVRIRLRNIRYSFSNYFPCGGVIREVFREVMIIRG